MLSIYMNLCIKPDDGKRFFASIFWPKILIIICFISSCQTTTTKTISSASTDTSVAIINLPKPLPIGTSEALQLNQACERWYDSALLYKGFSGGILVAKNGNIVFEKYTGTCHIPGTDFITATTPLQIASVSKTFTAMAVLKLWQEGKINIDDELSQYLTEFNYPGVTIRSLLNHRSGLPNYLYFMESLGWDKTQMVTNQDVLNYLITKKMLLPNIAPPNTHFTYCNTNYALLALLVEKITHEKFSIFMQQIFFKPLQMKNTFVYNVGDSTKINLSYDFRGRVEALNFLDGVYGDKNIYTTPRDLLIWDRALSTNILFTAQTLSQAYAPYSNEKPGIKNYGLGWRMNIYPDGKKMIFHNGWWHGSNATFIRLLDEKATIIVIGNKFNRNIYHAKILCNLFGNYFSENEDEETENTKYADTVMPTKLRNNNLPPQPLSKKNVTLKNFFEDKNKVNTH